jgi:hypothetical protein
MPILDYCFQDGKQKTPLSRRKTENTMKFSASPLRSLMSGSFDEKSGNVSVVKSQQDTSARWKSQEDDELSRISVATTIDETNASDCSSFRDESIIAAVVPMTAPDKYGQRHPIESDTLIALELANFEYQSKLLDSAEKVALNEATRRCPELLTKEFKLMFLRCECFNAKVSRVSS